MIVGSDEASVLPKPTLAIHHLCFSTLVLKARNVSMSCKHTHAYILYYVHLHGACEDAKKHVHDVATSHATDRAEAPRSVMDLSYVCRNRRHA
jgi:hypothetical protein